MRWILPLLALALMATLLLRTQGMAPTPSLDGEGLDGAVEARDAHALQDLRVGNPALPSSAAQVRRITPHQPLHLTLRHAEDQSPLFACGVWLSESVEPEITGPDGACVFPDGLPFGPQELQLDLNADGQFDLSIPFQHQAESEDVFVPDVLTLLLVQEPGTPPLDEVSLVRRAQGGYEHDTKHAVHAPQSPNGHPWVRFTADQLSELIAWDLVARAEERTGRRPIHNRSGTQVLEFDLRRTADFFLDLSAYKILQPRANLYVQPGQPLDLIGSRSRVLPGKGVRWTGLREGAYRVTLDSLSHEWWESDVLIKSTDVTIVAHPHQGSSRRLHGQIVLLPAGEIPSAETKAIHQAIRAAGIGLSLRQEGQQASGFNVPLTITGTPDAGIQAILDLPGVRNEPWMMSPYIRGSAGQMGSFEPSQLAWSEIPFHFRWVPPIPAAYSATQELHESLYGSDR